jgi:hypothetical protein
VVHGHRRTALIWRDTEDALPHSRSPSYLSNGSVEESPEKPYSFVHAGRACRVWSDFCDHPGEWCVHLAERWTLLASASRRIIIVMGPSSQTCGIYLTIDDCSHWLPDHYHASRTCTSMASPPNAIHQRRVGRLGWACSECICKCPAELWYFALTVEHMGKRNADAIDARIGRRRSQDVNRWERSR